MDKQCLRLQVFKDAYQCPIADINTLAITSDCFVSYSSCKIRSELHKVIRTHHRGTRLGRHLCQLRYGLNYFQVNPDDSQPWISKDRVLLRISADHGSTAHCGLAPISGYEPGTSRPAAPGLPTADHPSVHNY